MVKAICPHCGADQHESSIAVSTFCRNCGEHYKLEPAPKKKSGFSFGALFGGKSKDKPTKSFLQPAPGSGSNDEIAVRETNDWEEDVAPAAAPPSLENTARIQLERPGDDWSSGHQLTSSGHVVVEGPSALPPSGKILKERIPSPTDRAVPCVDCNTILYVSEHASSTICPHCSAYCSLQDYDIRTHRRENIKTRGDVTIHKKSSLTASALVCSNLVVYGQVSGQIDCAGEAIFRSSGKVIGSMRCKHLKVFKNCELQFLPGIRAESATIDGSVIGDIICEGTITIAKTGAVIGDCIAPAIKLIDGGTLSGQMRIMKPDKQLEEDYARRAHQAKAELFADGDEPTDADAAS
ncbi:MAG: cytoskeletal protein CcmA (bactofilin family) [Verrucomicrobiales bacterium]